MLALRRAAVRFGAPMDNLLLALIAIGILRADRRTSMELTLYVPMRDGPGEGGLVGLFADWRSIGVRADAATSTVLGVVLAVARTLRLRQWQVFNALTKAETIMVNFQRRDSAPPGGRQGFTQVGIYIYIYIYILVY